MRRALLLLIIAFAAPTLVSCAEPALLRGVPSGAVELPTCERSSSGSSTDFPPGDLDQRLAARYPAGSSASALAKDLRRQGFKLRESCGTDVSVHWATHRSGWRFANIYWKVDPRGNLVWTRGYVAWDGL